MSRRLAIRDAISIRGALVPRALRDLYTVANLGAAVRTFDETGATIVNLRQAFSTLLVDLNNADLINETGSAEPIRRRHVSHWKSIRLAGHLLPRDQRAAWTLSNHGAADRALSYTEAVLAPLRTAFGTFLFDLATIGLIEGTGLAVSTRRNGPSWRRGVVVLDSLVPPALRQAWTITNVGADDRAIDYAAALEADVAATLATLIQDVEDFGVFSTTVS